MGILLAIFVFALIISIHEFGHLLAAKALGVGVIEYSIGMGPAICSKRIGDTVYALRIVPFGGYCAMYGENSAEGEAAAEQSKKETKRRAKVKAKYKEDWKLSQSLALKPWWQRLIVFVAGPFFNIVLGFLACVLMVVVNPLLMSEPCVEAVLPDTPAAVSGIQAGDIIYQVDDRVVYSDGDYREYVLSHADVVADGFDIRVRRNGENILIRGYMDEETGLFGIRLGSSDVPHTFANFVKYSWSNVRFAFLTVGDSIYMLFHKLAHLSDMSGVVGITSAMSGVFDSAIEGSGVLSPFRGVLLVICYMTSLLSINVGLLNMIPFPALDGGRSVMCLFEGIVRKPFPRKVELAINKVGMALLMCLLIYTLVNDVLKLIVSLSNLN